MKCTGFKIECVDVNNHCFVGDGIFVCKFYNSQSEKCELKEVRD